MVWNFVDVISSNLYNNFSYTRVTSICYIVVCLPALGNDFLILSRFFAMLVLIFVLLFSYLSNVYTFLTLTCYFRPLKSCFLFVIYLYRLFVSCAASASPRFFLSLRMNHVVLTIFYLIDLHIYCYFAFSMVIVVVCESVMWMINKLRNCYSRERWKISIHFVYKHILLVFVVVVLNES